MQTSLAVCDKVKDGGQNILVSYVYEGFGKIVGQNGGGGGSYQFCGLWGYRNDWDAGLMHVGARYYEFEIERFVQKDPLLGVFTHPQTLNRYVYSTNDPINDLDPEGLIPEKLKKFLRELIVAIVCLIGGEKSQRPSDIVRKIELPPAAVEPYKGRMKDHPITFLPLPMDVFLAEAKHAAENFWEGREKTGGILHAIIAKRSGIYGWNE